MKEIQKCAVVIYDISLDKDQINEAFIALQGKIILLTSNKILHQKQLNILLKILFQFFFLLLKK